MQDSPQEIPKKKETEEQIAPLPSVLEKYFNTYADEFSNALNKENAAGAGVEDFLKVHEGEIKNLTAEEKFRIQNSITVLQGFHYTTPSRLKDLSKEKIAEEKKEIEKQIRLIIKLISSK